jgi:uncharacterized membrane protein YeiH
VVDLTAILLLAVEGALLGAAAGLNVFGVLAVAFISSLGGGIVRDLLIQATPPAALKSVLYPLTAAVGAIVVIAGYGLLREVPMAARIPLDAATLGVLGVFGTVKALDHRMGPLTAVVLGVIGSAGGGVIRDLMLGSVPALFRADVYVIAGAAGATLTVAAIKLGLPRPVAIALGVTACFAVRVISVSHGWSLPQLTG